MNTEAIFPVIGIRTDGEIGKIFLNGLQTGGDLSLADPPMYAVRLERCIRRWVAHRPLAYSLAATHALTRLALVLALAAAGVTSQSGVEP